MDTKTINNIVWYIPFKKLRNSIRELLLYFYNKSNSDINSKYIIFNLDKSFEDRFNSIIHISKFFNYTRTKHGDDIKELIPNYKNNILYYSDFGNIENKIQESYDINKIYQVFNLLNDEYSKDIYLMQLINYLFVGENDSISKGIMFNLYYSHIWKYYDEFKNTKLKDVNINDSDYSLYDLNMINIPIKLYYNYEYGIFADFIIEQYRYKNLIKVESGDFVIDAGGYFGDTALYFANLTGKNGKVYSFEFIEDNLKIFNKNIELNPEFQDIIEIIKKPLYSESNKEISFSTDGSSSRVSEGIGCIKYNTISIDDFVFNNNIKKIDFIKMDIEGAEIEALKGAEKTISKFRPKLAISLYHTINHYYDIPLLIYNIMDGYEFYFDHFKMGRGESILFCKPI